MSQEVSQNEDFEIEDFNPDDLHSGDDGEEGNGGAYSTQSRPPSYSARGGVPVGGAKTKPSTTSKKGDEQELVFDIGEEDSDEEHGRR